VRSTMLGGGKMIRGVVVSLFRDAGEFFLQLEVFLGRPVDGLGIERVSQIDETNVLETVEPGRDSALSLCLGSGAFIG
jgi:hypothetical protein